MWWESECIGSSLSRRLSWYCCDVAECGWRRLFSRWQLFTKMLWNTFYLPPCTALRKKQESVNRNPIVCCDVGDPPPWWTPPPTRYLTLLAACRRRSTRRWPVALNHSCHGRALLVGAFRVCAYELMTSQTGKDTDRLFVMVTPKIDVTRAMSITWDDSWIWCRFFESVNIISFDFDRFIVRLFFLDHISIFSSSLALVFTFMAGITEYVSSANLHSLFPSVTVVRSPAFATYAVVPMSDLWTTLVAVM